jgi:uncharacterized membrane protein YfcA
MSMLSDFERRTLAAIESDLYAASDRCRQRRRLFRRLGAVAALSAMIAAVIATDSLQLLPAAPAALLAAVLGVLLGVLGYSTCTQARVLLLASGRPHRTLPLHRRHRHLPTEN